MSDPEIDSVIDKAVAIGAKYERARIIRRIEAQICFDAKAASEGRCANHSGKCHELTMLVAELKAIDNA
jgi:hypothetical protein